MLLGSFAGRWKLSKRSWPPTRHGRKIWSRIQRDRETKGAFFGGCCQMQSRLADEGEYEKWSERWADGGWRGMLHHRICCIIRLTTFYLIGHETPESQSHSGILSTVLPHRPGHTKNSDSDFSCLSTGVLEKLSMLNFLNTCSPTVWIYFIIFLCLWQENCLHLGYLIIKLLNLVSVRVPLSSCRPHQTKYTYQINIKVGGTSTLKCNL